MTPRLRVLVEVYQDDQLLIAESGCWLKTRRRPARRRATGCGKQPDSSDFRKILRDGTRPAAAVPGAFDMAKQAL
jgi:hypothetical protein